MGGDFVKFSTTFFLDLKFYDLLQNIIDKNKYKPPAYVKARAFIAYSNVSARLTNVYYL